MVQNEIKASTTTTALSTIRNWLLDKKLHIIIWLIFMLYEAGIIGLFSGHFSPLSNYIIYYTLNITLFYVHTHIVLDKALMPSASVWLRLPVFIVLELISYMLITIVLDYLVINYTGYTGTKKIAFNLQYFAGPVYRAIYFMFFSTGYYFLLRFLTEQKKTEDLEKQRLNNLIQIQKSENAFLKAQVQPHLLFNTLDFIYQNARESSPVAAETILSLSEMMRYAIDSNKDKDLITIGEEINQIENLINLHQLRKNHTIQIRLWYEDEIKTLEIIPLVLITLVENMFKHGDMIYATKPAEINLHFDGRFLQIETSNLINLNENTAGTGLGMENIAKRLKFAYGENATFSFQKNDDNYFLVKLTIDTKFKR